MAKKVVADRRPGGGGGNAPLLETRRLCTTFGTRRGTVGGAHGAPPRPAPARGHRLVGGPGRGCGVSILRYPVGTPENDEELEVGLGRGRAQAQVVVAGAGAGAPVD